MKRRAASVVTMGREQRIPARNPPPDELSLNAVQSFPNHKVGASDTFVTTPSIRHTLGRDALGHDWEQIRPESEPAVDESLRKNAIQRLTKP
jgi:hypothetical protein